MQKPSALHIPPIGEGRQAIIWWDAADHAGEYELERRTSDEPAFEQLYAGADQSLTDRIPTGITFVEYRVRSLRFDGPDWNELNSLEKAWITKDSESLPWHSLDGVSEWTYSGAVEITQPGPSVVVGLPESYGYRNKGFPVTFSIAPVFPEDISRVNVYWETSSFLTALQQFSNVQAGDLLTYTLITDDFLSSWNLDTDYYVRVDMYTGDFRTIKRVPVRVTRDEVPLAVFYVLRDGIPVARLKDERRWTDYLAVGTHSYVIRGVDQYDNYTDSNDVVITIDLRHPVIAPVDDASAMRYLHLRLNEKPRNSHSLTRVSTEPRFEGMELPAMTESKQWSSVRSLEFTHLSVEEFEALTALRNRIIVYRDQYYTREFGQIQAHNTDFIRRHLSRFDAAVNFTLQMDAREYEERIAYG